MERVLRRSRAGETMLPLRSILWLPERVGALGLMPGASDAEGVLGLKVITVLSRKRRHGARLAPGRRPPLRGRARAASSRSIDATSITAIRTAAVSGVATRLLARRGRRRPRDPGLGRPGAHAPRGDALRADDPARARLEPAPRDRAGRFAASESARHGVADRSRRHRARGGRGRRPHLHDDVRRASPSSRGDWIAPGAHVNAVGASIPAARELDTAAVVPRAPLRRPARVAPQRSRGLPHREERRARSATTTSWARSARS